MLFLRKNLFIALLLCLNITFYAAEQDTTLVTLCKADSVTLYGSDGLYYLWGEDDRDDSLLITTNKDTIIHLTVFNSDQDLVVNGDFSNGNTDFVSSYFYSNDIWPEGNYWVGPNARKAHKNLSGYDHTKGNGFSPNNFFVVNGAGDPNTVVWEQTIEVEPNTKYSFSCWTVNVINLAPARLQFSINGTQIGDIFWTDEHYKWHKFYNLWDSQNNTTATIRILNQNTTDNGNDFGIDDISFRPVVGHSKYFKIDVADDTVTSLDLKIHGGTEFCQNSLDKLYWVDDSNKVSSYRWWVSGNRTHSNKGNEMFSVNWVFPGVDTVFVERTDYNGCKLESHLIASVAPYPFADFENEYLGNSKFIYTDISTQDDIIQEDTTIELNLTTYWDFGLEADAPFRALQPEELNQFDTIEYIDERWEVRLKVENDYGCADSLTVPFYVKKPYSFAVPNAFAPGHDAEKVRSFTPVGYNLKRFEITVFDNWGNTVWYSTELTEDGQPAQQWDGTWGGEALKSDTYIWRIFAMFGDDSIWETESIDEDRYNYGTVTLIR